VGGRGPRRAVGADRPAVTGPISLDCRGVPRPTGRGLSTAGRGPYPHIHSHAPRHAGRGFGCVPGPVAACVFIHRPRITAGGPCLYVHSQTPAPPNHGRRPAHHGPRPNDHGQRTACRKTGATCTKHRRTTCRKPAPPAPNHGPRITAGGPRTTENRQKKPATRAGKFKQGIAGPRPASLTRDQPPTRQRSTQGRHNHRRTKPAGIHRPTIRQKCAHRPECCIH